MRDAVAAVKPLIDRSHHELTIDLAEEPIELDADGARLTQIVANLLTNAARYTPEGGKIVVRAWSDRDLLRIEVRDSGEGIPKEQLPYIFDKYFQVSQQARTKGAGLGLAIALEVVEAHGGTIDVDSQPGRGTTFTINIPLHRAGARNKSVVEKTA